MRFRLILVSASVFVGLCGPGQAFDRGGRGDFETLVAQHASAQGIPASLIHRVIRAESNYNPGAAHRGNYGLMQISYGTARGLGYRGPAAGLLDANTNLAFGVPYLARAYRVAGGNQERAIRLYRSGFYYQAKRRGLLDSFAALPTAQPQAQAAPQAQTPAQGPSSIFAALFGSPNPAPAAAPSEAVTETGSLPRRGRHHHRRHYR